MDTSPKQPESSLSFSWIKVPSTLVKSVHALTQAAVEEGQPAAEVADLTLLVADILCYRVPRSTLRPSASLVRLAVLQPFLSRLRRLDSELELRMLMILAEAGVALHFETGCKIAVQYPDRCSEDDWGEARPDYFHRRAKLAIFCDSDEFHSSAEARARDNGVTSGLRRRGIRVLRFTGAQIRKTPLAVGRTIVTHLAPEPPRGSPTARRNAA